MDMTWKTSWFYLKQAGVIKYTITVLVIFFASIIFSLVDQSWEHVSRCGGIITVFGATLLGRDLIRLGPYHANEPKPELAKRVGKVNQFNPDAMWADVAEKVDNYAKYIGRYVIVVGTILWSYGDFLLQLIWPLNK
jgi:hypothetical protein